MSTTTTNNNNINTTTEFAFHQQLDNIQQEHGCYRQHKKQQPKSARTYASSSSHIGRSLEEPTGAELQKMLDKKQRDLDFAAQLGHSLLMEKKELLEKNEFLEESLATKIEIITQLQRTLKQRSKLVHTIMDLESEQDEEQRDGSTLRSDEVLRLEQQIKRLNAENSELRVKSRHLEELKQIVERREEQRIDEYISQLRAANLKIAQLQVQLNEKTNLCESQTEEVQHLLKDISQRKMRERNLWDENDTLNCRLDEALNNHQQLRNEMEQLQERHFDLISMLHEIETELKMHREKEAAIPPVPPRRTNSTDSLYDSLASELEGADSGCYNTPMFSARYGPSPHWSSVSGDQQPSCSSNNVADHQQQMPRSLEMEPIMEQSFTATKTAENEDNSTAIVYEEDEQQHNDEQASNCKQNHQQQSFDVPSRALLEVVRCTFDERRKFRRTSPSRKQQLTFLPQQEQQCENCDDNLMMMMPDEEQNTPTIPNVIQIASGKIMETEMTRQQSTENQPPNVKQFRDVSCSPIQFSTTSSSTNTTPRISKTACGGKQFVSTTVQTTPSISQQIPVEKRQKQTTTRILARFPSAPSQNHFTKNNEQQIAPSSSIESVDSLEEYNPSKLGAPGKPGTRDLDISIKRLELRKEITKQYQRFRKCKGLQPEKYNFYTQNGQGKFQSVIDTLCPSKQFAEITKNAGADGVISSSFFARYNRKPTTKCAKFLNQLNQQKISGQETIGFNQLAALPSLSTSALSSSTSLMTAAMIAFGNGSNNNNDMRTLNT